MGEIPLIGRCGECGYEATLEELRKTVFDTVKTLNGEYSVYALEDEKIDFEISRDDAVVAKFQLRFRCPACQNQETWTI